MSSSLDKDRSYDQCNNIGCMTTRDDGRLLKCGGCGVARYCVRRLLIILRNTLTLPQSKECQKSDWKNHKPACKRHRFARDTFSQNPNDDIYMRVSKWILKHRPSLGDALVCSLNVPKNPQAQRKSGLQVSVKYLADQPDDRCLVITAIERLNLDDLTALSPEFAMAADSRHSYEVQSLRADAEMYGTGLVFLLVWQELDYLFMRGLPITFDHVMAEEVVPAKDSVWQEDLLRKTGCIPLIEAGLAHTCCAHCRHPDGTHDIHHRH